MKPWSRACVFAVVALVALAGSASAQLEENLAAYSDENAEGYLKPLQTGFGQILNSTYFTSANVARGGFHLRLDVKAMSVLYQDDDRMFTAKTEGDFMPEQTASASTAVGPGTAVTVDGDGGTVFVFPGGFDLSSLTGGVPQITIGNLYGTEAAFRFFRASSGSADIGEVGFWGLGIQHSISQYFENPPLHFTAVGTYQALEVNTDLLKSSAFSLGARGGGHLLIFEVFGGLTYDWVSMEAKYEALIDEEMTTIDLKMSAESSIHASLGLEFRLGPLALYASGELAQRFGLTAGLGIGF